MAKTNTLIKRIQEVRAVGDAFRNSNRLKNKKDEIEQGFLPAYKVMSGKVKGAMRSYVALTKICTISVDFEGVVQSLISLNSKVQSDVFDKESVYSISREIGTIQADMERSWQNYIRGKTADITSIVQTLDKLIVGMPEKQTLDSKRRIFMNASIGAPEAINAISDYNSVYNVLMGKLSLKESVLKFLKLFATDRTVTLDDMNEEVYTWFKDSDFSRKIIINMRT